MKIAVDYQSAEGRRTGIGVAAVNLVSAIRDQAPDIALSCYVTGKPHDLNTAGRILWESVHIPCKVMRDRPDLVWSPGFAPALLSPAPQIVTVHDLIGMLFPQNLSKGARFYWSRWLPFCVRRARTLVASSESTRRDIERLLGRDASRIEVVPLAAGVAYRPVADREALAAVRRKYGLEGEYFLTVGTLEPRKNLPNLLRAFSIFRKKRTDGPRLALAGKCGGVSGPLAQLIRELGLSRDVSLLGYVPDEDMSALCNASLGYAFVSTYEGFGLPVLEAMQCGKSGVVSGVSSLPEVAGDTALYVDPLNPDDIADKLMLFASDSAGRARLEQAAMARAAEFSWDKAASRMVDIFRKSAS